jgi:hypothetical protein
MPLDDLDKTESLFIKVLSEYNYICPVCKESMPEDDDDYVIAFRIRDSFENRKKYGEDVIKHPFNCIYVNNNICKERVARAWENPSTTEKLKTLVESINEDNARFKTACQNAQMLLYLPKPKKRRK